MENEITIPFKKVKQYFRELKCPKCKSKLYSLYKRTSKTKLIKSSFNSIEGWYWCDGCSNCYKINMEMEKQK